MMLRWLTYGPVKVLNASTNFAKLSLDKRVFLSPRTTDVMESVSFLTLLQKTGRKSFSVNARLTRFSANFFLSADSKKQTEFPALETKTAFSKP